VGLPLDILPRATWFFDYDGSLCPHQEVWEERIYNPKEILDVLRFLTKQGSEVLWNTGRRPESLGDVELSFLEYSGYFIHGGVRWDAKVQKKTLLAPLLTEEWVQKFQSTPLFDEKKFRKEIKPSSFRLAPSRLSYLEELKLLVERFGSPQGWAWYNGHRGSELLPTTHDKSTAFAEYFAISENKGRVPIAVGDDVLDLPALQAAISRGGFGILVGENCGWITRLKHKAHQVLYFDRPKDLHDYILDFLKP
jgi:hypothetical protein